jgi:translation elongation factor EF-1alpha
VATGTLALGQRIALAAPSVVAEVRGIQLHHRALTEAGPGDSVGVHLANVELSQLRRGQVMSDADRDPVREVHELIAQVPPRPSPPPSIPCAG